MTKNELTNTTILYVIAISTLSTMALVFIVNMESPQKVFGQAEEVFSENATAVQEMEGGSPTANQTAAPTAQATNLTRGDIESFREDLNSAREGVQNSDAQAVLDSINAADSTLYVLVVEEPKGPVAEKLSALQDTLDAARDSIRANALEKALQDLNNADSQVLLITEMLPAEEPEEPEE
jgi:sugar diacid utilization regulator